MEPVKPVLCRVNIVKSVLWSILWSTKNLYSFHALTLFVLHDAELCEGSKGSGGSRPSAKGWGGGGGGGALLKA